MSKKTTNLENDVGREFCISGSIKKVAKENNGGTYLILECGNESYECYTNNNLLCLKRGQKISIEGNVEIIHQNNKNFYYIVIQKFIDEKYMSLEGIDEIELYGKVSNVQNRNDIMSFDVIQDSEYETKIFKCICEFEYPIKDLDAVRILGDVSYEKGIYIVNVSEITAKFNFDLKVLLLESFPFMKEESNKLEEFSTKIIDHFDFLYGNQNDSIHKGFMELCQDLETGNREKIDNFTSILFGEQKTNDSVNRVISFLMKYKAECVYRPFELLGVGKSIVDEILQSRSFSEAYKIVFENPNRLIEIPENIVNKIFSQYLKMEQQVEWKQCGTIGRYIYSKYKKGKWTSIPIIKLQNIFPHFSTFEDFAELYACSQYLDNYYYNPVLKMENVVAKKVQSLIEKRIDYEPIPIYLRDPLDDGQEQALKGSLTNGISILTGGAGTGKTKILVETANTLIKDGFKPHYAAYVGAAVQRIKDCFREVNEELLNKVTVMTIHLSLAMFEHLIERKITHVIFDECSMIDLELFYRFIDTFSRLPNLNYIFVGDINQLGPIKAGNVMNQFLKTPIKIFKLERNYRSEEGIKAVISEIVDKDRIEKCKAINWFDFNFPDFEFYTGGFKSIELRLEKYYDEMTEYQKERKSEIIKHIDNFTVVTYFKFNCKRINRLIQEIFLNGFRFETLDGIMFYERTKVMNLKNNYNINVMNGEMGKVIELDKNFIGVKFRNDENCKIPYFVYNKLKIIEKISKNLKITYSPFGKDEQTVKTEIDELAKRFSNFQNEHISNEDIVWFFDVVKKYPKAIFGSSNLSELSITNLTTAYCITTRKSQGNQFPICAYYLDKDSPFFINRREIYTGMSRAQNKLIVVCESESQLNSGILNSDLFTYENLHRNIQFRLPEEMRVQVVEEQEVVEIVEEEDCYDDVDFDDFF